MKRVLFSLPARWSWRTARRRIITAVHLPRIGYRDSSSIEFGKIRKHIRGLVNQHSSLLELLNSTQLLDSDGVEREDLYRRLTSLEPVVHLANELERKEKEKCELELLTRQSDGELGELACEELCVCREEIERLESLLVNAVIPRDKADEHSAVLELRVPSSAEVMTLALGAGGQEAALFSSEMLDLYRSYAAFKGWTFELLSEDITDKGGIKYASASLSGEGVFGRMKHESGVHRVQRVPQTEASGRIHTSTMTVVILPQPTQVEVNIDASDIKIETLRASGAGGQHVNTTDSAVRLTHLPTGTVIHIQDERSQHKNRAKALKLLRARLYERQRTQAQRERSEQRALQIAGGERSEKIRTYNYPQDRVTDHRLATSIYGVAELMTGEALFDELIQRLHLREKAHAIGTLTDNSNDKQYNSHQ